jgi:hypothetical protein
MTSAKTDSDEIVSLKDCVNLSIRWNKERGFVELKYLLSDNDFTLEHVVIDGCSKITKTTQTFPNQDDSLVAEEAFEKLQFVK